jgi:micrococcal nuclease
MDWKGLRQNFLLVPVCVLILTPFLHAQKTDFTNTLAYEVVDIIDGDTVRLIIDGRQTTVRLIGIDTPETVHPTKPVEPYGKRASEFLHNLLAGGSVYLEYGPERTDKYGRLLAYLYRAPDGLFVNLEIVRQGYGRAYTKYPFKYESLFARWDSTAQVRNRGLWKLVESQVEGGGPGTAISPGASKTVVAPKTTEGVTVYITRSGSKYHRDNCRYLSKSKKAITLAEASTRYSPCKVCKPTAGQAGQSYTPPAARSPSTSTRCQATTKKGTQCKRKAKRGSSYCWQHGE